MAEYDPKLDPMLESVGYFAEPLDKPGDTPSVSHDNTVEHFQSRSQEKRIRTLRGDKNPLDPRETPSVSQPRKITHAMARQAYNRMHDALYNNMPVPCLSIPPQPDDVDVILCDYIDQQAKLEKLAGLSGTLLSQPLNQEEEERKKFEAWAKGFRSDWSGSGDIMRFQSGNYVLPLIELAWQAWLARAGTGVAPSVPSQPDKEKP